MKNLIPFIFCLLVTSSTLAATVPAGKQCGSCAGIVADPSLAPTALIPQILQVNYEDRKDFDSYLAALTPQQREKTLIVISVSLEEGDDPVPQVEDRVQHIVEWASSYRPLGALGIKLKNAPKGIEGFAIKRLAVTTEGLDIAANIVFGPTSKAELETLYATGAQAYFDEVLALESDQAGVQEWLTEKDPAKRTHVIVTPSHPNVFFDAGEAIASGASWVYLPATSEKLATAVEAFNREFAGDLSADANANIELLSRGGDRLSSTALSFIRGEDLRSVVIPPGDAAAWMIVSLLGDDYRTPRRVSAAGATNVTDSGRKGGRYLVGVPPGAEPFLFTFDRPSVDDPNIARQTVNVVTDKGITVEEIIRRHQAYRAFQDSIQQKYIAHNQTNLRFAIGPGGQSVEATMAGDYFFDPAGKADWVWDEFLINGVKWKYGRIPEIPIVQAEKVSQIPLDLQLTNDYRYVLIEKDRLRGYETYEVQFEPDEKAPADLPLYRGTVWIDSRTWARVRVSMVQLNLRGEVLSNEERVDFAPFDRATRQPLTAEQGQAIKSEGLLWLPTRIEAQQVVSAAGRVTPVIRSTTMSKFQLDPIEFETRHREVSASEARMVRETEGGLKYLEKRGDGQRVVKEGIDSSRAFLLGGLHHDAGLEFPMVPLGGIDYFNFNIKQTGLQTNVFFAGVIVAANLTDPSFRGTRTNLGADFFGLAIPFENVSYRNGEEVPEESVKALPLNLGTRIGRPIFGFGKIDLAVDFTRVSFQRSETTGSTFSVPSDTFVITPSLHARYDRRGYTLGMFVERGTRTTWEPWGNLAEYDPEQKNFTKFGGSLARSFFLPNFQRFGIELNYLDGSTLDRFSKYELGFFGAQRIRGVQAGSVRAERALLGHLSYGLVFSQQFRLEAFYDHGLLDDAAAGYNAEPFQGIGIGGQTIGPRGTIVRLDVGKSVGRNAQDDFVANIVFLKLFN